MSRTRPAAIVACLALAVAGFTSATATTAEAGSATVAETSAGHGFTDALGHHWSRATSFHGGTTYRTRVPIAGTPRDRLFQNARYGVNSYRRSLPNGEYKVRLYLAEVRVTGRGQRVFDVYAEGRRVVRGLDVYRAVGRARAYSVTFRVTVSDSRLNLTFARRHGRTMLGAVEVTRVPTAAATSVPQSTPSPTNNSTATTPVETTPTTSTTSDGTSVSTPSPATTGTIEPILATVSEAKVKPSPTPTTASPTPTPTPTATTPAPTAFSATSGRPFEATSPFNVPVPSSPVTDGNSTAMVSALANDPHPGVADLYAYGVPIWDAYAGTPLYDITCTRDWGTCGLEAGPVPIPTNASATPIANDGAMVVVDWATRRSFEFYDTQPSGTGWTAGWGGVLSIDGIGNGGAATGSDISRLAGVVRTFEMRQGVINHALVFSTNNACHGVYRFPAGTTDGSSLRSSCIPEGARIQLDPSINVDAIANMTAGERMVAKALQKYGAYAIDNGGANMAFVFEVPSGETNPYPSVGFSGDYFGMDRIPWTRLRVLRQWDGR
jgi:hypothetical protein